MIALGMQASAITYPTLWVSDLLRAHCLNELFELAEYVQGDSDLAPGEHYILVEKGTPEAQIKAIAWRIAASSGECKVHSVNNYLENLVSDPLTAQELTISIIEFARPYEEWTALNDEVKLTLREAADIARLALALLPEPQKSIELGMLGKRCAQSSYDWNKLVRKLEEEFQQELRRRSVVTDDKDERLRLDLLALLSENDPIKKLRKRAEICSFYRLKTSEVEQALKLLKGRTASEEVKAWSVDELLALEASGLQWLIPELLPKGETIILAASPKAGKTLLGIDAAFAIATGESEFLGQSVQRGKVLLISCDESLNSTRTKLLKRGFRSQDTDIKIISRWTIDDLESLEKHLEDFRPDVVIIDSLRRITHGSQISENSAEFADNIYTLKETIGSYGASGILIHHTNKNSEAMGVGKLRGSSAIAGAVWGTWQVDHIPKPDPNNKKKMIIDPSDPRRVLTVFPRDTEGQSLNIEFNPENNSWSRLDEVLQTEQLSIRQQIINVLTSKVHLAGLSGREIIELLGMTPNEGRGVYTELNRMVNKRLINCQPASGDKRVNIYSLPIRVEQGDSPPPTLSVPIVEYSTESYTQQDFENIQPDTQQAFNNYSTANKENQDVEDLNVVPASDLPLLNNRTTTGGGVGVTSESQSKYYSDSENSTAAQSALKHSFSVGDEVQVLDEPKLKGKRTTISSITREGIWVRIKNAIAPFGPFKPHQLRKC